MRLSAFAAAATALALAASRVHAQQVTAPRSTVISLQPLTVVFSVYSAELEHAVSPRLTVGVGGSFWSHDTDTDDLRYSSGELKLRYYPEAHPFRGFSLGGEAGYTSISDKQKDVFGNGTVATDKANGPTLGVDLDYSWLLGETRAFYLGLGVGAKKIFATSSQNDNINLAYPTARVSVGYAF